MKHNLSAIRARVERVAAQIGVGRSQGCGACRGHEQIVRFWDADDPPKDADAAGVPCTVCGRVVPYHNIVFQAVPTGRAAA